MRMRRRKREKERKQDKAVLLLIFFRISSGRHRALFPFTRAGVVAHLSSTLLNTSAQDFFANTQLVAMRLRMREWKYIQLNVTLSRPPIRIDESCTNAAQNVLLLRASQHLVQPLTSRDIFFIIGIDFHFVGGSSCRRSRRSNWLDLECRSEELFQVSKMFDSEGARQSDQALQSQRTKRRFEVLTRRLPSDHQLSLFQHLLRPEPA